MGLFETKLMRTRPGLPGHKLWVSSPITVDANALLDAIEIVKRASGGRFSVFVNERLVEHHTSNLRYIVDEIKRDPRFPRVQSIAVVSDEVTVNFGPRVTYAHSKTGSTVSRGALWELQRLMRNIRWMPGELLYRTWGGAIAVVAAFIVGLFFAAPATSSTIPIIILAALAGGIYVGSAVLVGVSRRVRIDFDSANTRGASRRVAANALITVVTGALTVIIGGIVLAWLGFGPRT